MHCDGLVDGNGVSLDGEDALVLEGGRLAATGGFAGLSKRWPAAGVVAYPGCYAMPGLVNAHDHVTSRRSRLPLTRHCSLPPAAQVAFGVSAAARSLAEGITAARDMGGAGDTSVQLAQLVAAGRVAGPAMVICMRPLTVPGGAGALFAEPVGTTAAAEEAVRRLADAGAHFIKIFASTDGGAGQARMPADILAAICRSAARRGLIAAAHATDRQAVEDCVRSGVRCIEHGVGIDGTLAKMMADDGIWLVPTLSGFAVIATEGQQWGRGLATVAYFVSLLPAHRASFGAALAAGVRVAAGTDSLGSLALEASAMRECGASPAQVVRALTSAGADLLQLSQGSGRLRPGAPADLAIVEGNPLEDVAAIGRPVAVYRQGRVHVPADLRGAFPES